MSCLASVESFHLFVGTRVINVQGLRDGMRCSGFAFSGLECSDRV